MAPEPADALGASSTGRRLCWRVPRLQASRLTRGDSPVKDSTVESEMPFGVDRRGSHPSSDCGDQLVSFFLGPFQLDNGKSCVQGASPQSQVSWSP